MKLSKMNPKQITEAQIRRYYKAQVKKHGLLSVKFKSPGTSGVMDEMLATRKGEVWFIELKRPGKNLRELQQYIFDWFESYNMNCAKLNSVEEIDKFFKSLK